jgi:peptidyl-tRNA hydrolase
VSGHDDPEGEVPWAMQIACRVERADPPSHSAICAAAATAVVLLLHDERSAPDGEWHPAVDRWLAGRFRKHARRARGSSWDRVQALPGVRVVVDGAEVRAFLPCPVDAIPAEIKRLQLQGFKLDDSHPLEQADPEPGGAVVVELAAGLSTGKAAAAAAHAAQLAYAAMNREDLERWAAASFPVRIGQPSPERFAALVATAPVVVRDGGFTEVVAGTATAVARWV